MKEKKLFVYCGTAVRETADNFETARHYGLVVAETRGQVVNIVMPGLRAACPDALRWHNHGVHVTDATEGALNAVNSDTGLRALFLFTLSGAAGVQDGKN